MKLYNTLSRTKEEFTPLEGNTVKIYTCGPTVYNYAQIGNMRAYLFMDLLRRVLKYNGYSLKHMMNITDVGHLVSDEDEGEDKMAKSARLEQKSPWEIAEFYTEAFMHDIEALNISRPEIISKATDNIPEMIDFVLGLEKNGYTYEIDDGIYFDVQKFEGYGKLSRNKLDDLQAGARVEVNDQKRHPADFALWKKAPKEHIMQWESPWGMGYPGWHIECSAMGLKFLGEEFDIHTGGVDHIPIHHENEIAQSEGLLGHPAVRCWMHNEFLLVDGGKMSKSLGNNYTLTQLSEMGYEPDVYRYFCLNAHYRQKLNFTFEGMNSSKTALKNLRAAVQKHKGASDEFNDLEKFRNDFNEAVSDDLNIPKALGIIWTLAKNDAKNNEIYDFILKCDEVFGLNLDKEEAVVEIDFQELIDARTLAKKNKNFAEADRIRNEIVAMGYQLLDTFEGTICKPIG
ncbi:MAG: cysteine--tRNA ligase [Oscillospiraceae bacterium]|nr:cysteine--tRNA ligase [Oscillospiraceae bacterium]